MTQIKIGIDLDNTIINYQNSFKKILKKKKIYLKSVNKNKVKFLANNNLKFKNWTQAQEEIYGYYISWAKPFKHFKNFEKFAINNKIKLYIISHKTKYSQYTKKYNLHHQSNKWIKKNICSKFYQIFYVNTLNKKIKKIKEIKPDYFIDDLVEIFKDKNFPKKIKKIYFSETKDNKIMTLNSWKKIKNFIVHNENFK